MAVPPPIPLAFFTDSLEPSGVGEVIALLAVGGRGLLERNPLERLLRDAQAAPLQASCHEQCLERVAAELLRDSGQ